MTGKVLDFNNAQRRKAAAKVLLGDKGTKRSEVTKKAIVSLYTHYGLELDDTFFMTPLWLNKVVSCVADSKDVYTATTELMFEWYHTSYSRVLYTDYIIGKTETEMYVKYLGKTIYKIKGRTLDVEDVNTLVGVVEGHRIAKRISKNHDIEFITSVARALHDDIMQAYKYIHDTLLNDVGAVSSKIDNLHFNFTSMAKSSWIKIIEHSKDNDLDSLFEYPVTLIAAVLAIATCDYTPEEASVLVATILQDTNIEKDDMIFCYSDFLKDKWKTYE